MNDSNSEISGFLIKINILHKAIMASPIMLGTVVYLLADNPYLLILNAWALLLVFAISAIVLGFYLSGLFFKKYLSGISNNAQLSQKLERYQTAFLLKMVFLEMPALVSVAIFYLTQNLLYLIIVGGIVAYMSLQTPKKENIILSLDLRGAERDKINQAH